MNTLEFGAIVLVALINSASLVVLAVGLVRPTTAGVRAMARLCLWCGALALIAWLIAPAIHAATIREASESWSAADRQLVKELAPQVALRPRYSLEVLFDKFYYWPLPFLAALVLRYRARTLQRDEPHSALTDVAD
jgi:hypothetical protein